MTAQLPPIISLSTSPTSEIERALSLLLEPSESLKKDLVPAIYDRIRQVPTESYGRLIQACSEVVKGWSLERQAGFLGGHPRIGQVDGLSEMSASEQSSQAASPETLRKLRVRRICHLIRRV